MKKNEKIPKKLQKEKKIKIKTEKINTNSKKIKTKKHAIGVTKKQLIGYTISSIIAVIIIFMIIIPTLLGSLQFLIVLSGSMTPEVNQGDIVVQEGNLAVLYCYRFHALSLW